MAKHILVVDDDEIYLKMAKFVLKQNGYEVMLAGSGYEGIEIVQNEDVDLVLLDNEMPDLSGSETLQRIRMESRFKDLPVIFLTTSDSKKDMVRAEVLGAAGFVRKPFDPLELLERVAEVFE